MKKKQLLMILSAGLLCACGDPTYSGSQTEPGTSEEDKKSDEDDSNKKETSNDDDGDERDSEESQFMLEIELDRTYDKVTLNVQPLKNADNAFDWWEDDLKQVEEDTDEISFRLTRTGIEKVRFNATLCLDGDCDRWICEGHKNSDGGGPDILHVSSVESSYGNDSWNVSPVSAPGGPGKGCSLFATP